LSEVEKKSKEKKEGGILSRQLRLNAFLVHRWLAKKLMDMISSKKERKKERERESEREREGGGGSERE